MKYDNNMDKECVPICDAINRIPGLETIESCCGHGRHEFNVWFRVHNPDWLPVLLYYCDPCHSGFQWDCLVTTDCVMQPVSYCIRSHEVGKKSYREAQEIADEINSFMDNEDRIKEHKKRIKFWKKENKEES